VRHYHIGASEITTVRFLIAHEPTSVFDAANDVFRATLHEQTNGELALEVLTPNDLGMSQSDLTRADIEELMAQNLIDVSAIPTSEFSADVPETDVILLPFLFRDHNTLFSFLDGSAGETLLESISRKTSVQALAYTLSGGFRVVALRKKNSATDVSDLAGSTIISPWAHLDVVQDGLTTFSAGAVPITDETVISADGVEVVYTRIAALPEVTSIQSIIETKHTPLVTIMFASDAFFSHLKPAHQEGLRAAVLAAARTERAASISLAEQTKERLSRDGVSIISVSDKKRELLRQSSMDIYESHSAIIGSQLMEAVRTIQR